MFDYLISFIYSNNTIERKEYATKEEAEKMFGLWAENLRIKRNCKIDDGIIGLQLWQYRKGKTIDNDFRALVIMQHYK